MLKRKGVCDGDVAGDVDEQDGVFRTDGVERWRVGNFLSGQSVWSQPEPTIHSAFLVSGDGGGNGLLDLLDAGDAVDANGQHICACAAHMHVRVVEAGSRIDFQLDRFDVSLAPHSR